MTSARRLCGLAGLATLLLGFSGIAASASPARVASNTNLRQGPGTTFGVVAVVPGGSVVEVTGCSGEWCTANWHGRVGYMISTHLDLAAGPVGPRVVAVYPEPYYGPYFYGGPYFYNRFYFGSRYYGHYGRRRW
jgi:uncharacterized protein YraI